MRQKCWQYLMLATLILGATGPLTSVVAADGVGNESSPAAATTSAADVDATAAPEEAAPAPSEAPATEAEGATPPATAEPESDESDESEDAATPDTTQTEDQQATAPDAEASEATPEPAGEESPVTEPEVTEAEEPETKTDATLSIAAPDSIFQSQSDSAALEYDAVGKLDDQTESEFAWQASASLQLNQAQGAVVKVSSRAETTVNHDAQVAGQTAQLTASNSLSHTTATHTLTVGGLTAITVSQSTAEQVGFTHTTTAAASLPHDVSWHYQWLLFHTDEHQQVTGDPVTMPDADNVSGDVTNPADSSFAIHFPANSTTVKTMTESSRQHRDMALVLRIAGTDASGKQYQLTSNLATAKIAVEKTTPTNTGSIALTSVPTVAATHYSLLELHTNITKPATVSSALQVEDSRSDAAIPATRWQLTAHANNFQNAAGDELPFKYLLTTSEQGATAELDGSTHESVPA